ncbi:MAG: DHH family phosphoesterase [Clostridia bacterium]|nr:DHH family phosphoesterase [Clostridia bacterium]
MKNEKQGRLKQVLKNVIKAYPITIPATLICIVMSLIMLKYNKLVALVGILLTVGLVLVSFVIRVVSKRKLEDIVNALDSKLQIAEEGEGLRKFPLPVVLFDDNDSVVWYNKLFFNCFIEDSLYEGNDVKQFTSGNGVDAIREAKSIECTYGKKKYTAYPSVLKYQDKEYHALYFVDDTLLKKYKSAYLSTRPVFMIIILDSVDDALNDFRDSQKSEILGEVETIIENWFAKYNCILRKVQNTKFLVFAEKENLIKMMEDKFSILSNVRSYTYENKQIGLTLSIGVGLGENLPQCEKIARKALDMAMGRGGDQVAVKPQNGEYEFFGGVSKGIEKRNKTRIRMIASAIKELIKTSDNVLIMGHRFADLDALGSSVGVAMICKALGKDAKIVMLTKTSLAMPLVRHLIANDMGSFIVEPEDVDEHISEKTLLVIVDTHRQSFLEAPELFDKVDRMVVIDHHRKTVDHINKAVIFFHEPFSSSASEMVTELIQYVNVDVDVPKACAEALMSGITLDTKNFVMKTGVRTFEAAAFLRSLGADTVAVKQLFANSMDTQKAKSEVIKNSSMYQNCSIGVIDYDLENIRIVASQAADELLNIDGVKGSFVLFLTGDTVNISARSYGDINVQLVMEELGGGGHLTMAAAQLIGENIENAIAQLKCAIDKIV